MERQIQKSITITNHAMKRLKERVKTFGDHKSWQDPVKDARYNGTTYVTMTQEQYDYIWEHFDQNKHDKSMMIRFFEGFFYVFRGNNRHARTLVTVIAFDKNNKHQED